jgi:ATP-dependent helicase/nuclease subunit B
MGTALSGKTDFLAEKMVAAHLETPLSYTFLGPSGVFVKEFSEWFARRMKSSIPRGNFLVIDQFAVELFIETHPGMIHADEHILNVFVASILGTASKNDLGPFYPLKDSHRLAAFVVEAVKDAKDDGEADLWARFANEQARSLMQFVLKELEARYDSNLFDTFDAYRNINSVELKSQINSRFGGKLFLDGFTNLSDAQIIFLSNILPLFDEAFMTLDPALVTSESWNKLRGMLEAKSIQICEIQLMSSLEASTPLERLLAGEGPRASLEGSFIKINRYKDPEEELIQVCRQIKRRIVDEAMEPGEIAVVLNNFSERAGEFSRKLDEYGIPVRVSGEEPLSSSIAVQLLILPFKSALAGYPSQILISMLDHGLGLVETAEFDLDNLEALATGAGLYMGPRRASLQDRREDWRSKLHDHLAALRQRLEILRQDESVYEGDLQVQESEIHLCQVLIEKSEELFQSLERIEAARSSQANFKLFRDELASWIAPLNDRLLNDPELESEVMAIGKLEHMLGQLEVVVSTMGKQVLTLSEFMAFMEILLSSEEFRPSSPLANTVEILSLHSARFKHRPLKFIVNFNDGIYPARRANPLYSLEDQPSGKPGYYNVKEREQREALYSCLCTSSEAIITYPVASREGEPMLPSLWLDAWSYDETDASEVVTTPMSAQELGIEFGFKLARGEEPIVAGSTPDLLAALKLYADSEFSWKIREKAVVDSLVGRKFSYTKLSDFSKCPFKFFLRRILGLEERSIDLYELSPLELGSTYHAALKSLYDMKCEGMSLDHAIECGKVRHEIEVITQRFLAANRIRSLPVVREAMINAAAQRVQTYLEFELDTPEKAFIGERTLTEIPFSIQLAEMADILSKTAQKYGDMVFLGRIDRIDLNVIGPGKGKAKKKQESKIYDIVLSDYKSSSAGDWDQLKLYTMALLSLDLEALPKNPALMKSFFRIIKSGKISLKLDAFPAEGRMEMHGRGKKSLTFSDIDRELLNTLDRIYEQREFLPGRAIDGKAGDCYFCGFKPNCEPLLDLRGGSQ